MDFVLESEVGGNLAKFINKVATEHDPVVIKGNDHDAVLISKEDWDAIQETLYLVSIPGMKDAILEGGKIPLEECIPVSEIER